MHRKKIIGDRIKFEPAGLFMLGKRFGIIAMLVLPMLLSGVGAILMLPLGVTTAGSNGGSASPLLPEEWNKTFGEGFASSVQQISDGGYILITNNNQLIKTDITGTLQWNKTIGQIDSVQHASDGGYVITAAGLVIKTDANGTLQWNKTYIRTQCINPSFSVQQTSDGGYILLHQGAQQSAASITIYTTGCSMRYDVNSGFGITKLDANGNFQWNKTLGKTASDAYSVGQALDGGYIIAGTMSAYDEYGDNYAAAWLTKLDASGNLQWNKSFGDGAAYSIQRTLDGNYVFVIGNRLVKIDAEGTIKWNKPVKPGIISVQQTSDGGYIIVSSSGGITKTNENGDTQWSRESYDLSGYVTSVQQTSDGGYIIAGSELWSRPHARGTYAWLMKVPNESSWPTTQPTLTPITTPYTSRPNTTYPMKCGDSYECGDYTVKLNSVDTSVSTSKAFVTVTGPTGNSESKILRQGTSYQFLSGGIEIGVNAVGQETVAAEINADCVIKSTFTPTATPTSSPTITSTPVLTPTATPFPQLATWATNPEDKNCRQFPTSYDVPKYWTVVESCPAAIAATPTAVVKQCDNGCLVHGDTCVQFGTRLIANDIYSYCNVIKKTLERQKADGATCQNSYECLSNYCSDGGCGNLQKELSATRGLLEQILGFLRAIFGKFFPAAK